MKKSYLYSIPVSVLLGFVISCSSTPQQTAQVSQIPIESNPSEVIAQFEQELSDARSENINWLAPTNYEKAVNALTRAKTVLRNQGKNSDAFQSIQEGRVALQQAEKSAKIAETSLPNAIKAREGSMEARIEAEKSGANDLRSTYSDADSHFLKLTRAIENDNLKWAENNQEETMRLYRVATADANKKRYLDSAKQMIEAARKEGAGSYAPAALKQAENAYSTTEKFADNNPYATDQILHKGEETLAVAKRTLNLTRESQMFDRWQPEQRVLWVEKNLARLGKDLDLPPEMAAMSFNNQVGAIEKSLKEVTNVAMLAKGAQSDKERMKGQVEALKGEVQDKQSELAQTIAFDQKFKAVQSQFDGDEAEVLREGDKLIIRVRSINFPVGKAEIQRKDFALLNKLQKAISTFDNSKVIVEGHTDSTGTASLNRKLSQERANAVREYLVANESVSPDDIRAVGKGFSKPLADNKTATGRAENRRIDLVVEPMGTVSASGDSSEDEPSSAE
jgi:OmpA-OmpF porin, OOP family